MSQEVKKVPLSRGRHRAREIALQLLYSLDLRPDQNVEEALELFPFEEGEGGDVIQYASSLVRGVWAVRAEIDNEIRRHVVGWRPERMVAVDLAAVRLALYEGVIARLVPLPVAISEAVDLAKKYGTEHSGRFVNGVLGRIVRALELEESVGAGEGQDPRRG